MITAMPILSVTVLSSLLALASPPAAAPPPAAAANPGQVRIYRCVSSRGAVALQDHPCRQGQQQILERQRPQDPPPATRPPRLPDAVPAPAAAAPPPTAPTRVIVVNSQPLFECITPEGERYTADDGQGNPRWVPGPLVPVFIGSGSGHGRPQRPHRPPSAPDAPQRPLHAHPGGHGVATAVVAAGGQWVRDSCQQLTRQEACQALGEQRWELIGRYNSALSSEREQLVRQQRRVEERMARQPCEP